MSSLYQNLILKNMKSWVINYTAWYCEWTLDFQNEEKKLYDWKRKTEKEQVREFIIACYKYNHNSDSLSRMIFTCLHDDEFTAKWKHVQHTKLASSNKINGHSLAKLDVMFHPLWTITVQYWKTHVGHTAHLGCTRLSEMEKNDIMLQTDESSIW